MMVSKLRGVFAAPALALGMGVTVLGAGTAFAAPVDDFNAELQSGYSNLAAGERSEFDYVDGRMFQTKADKVAAGGSVLPEVLADWNLMDEDVGPITDARARLMDALNGGVIDITPVPLARAQWNFDCWVQEAEENMQPEHIEPCRQGFEAAMADIRYPAPPEPEPETIEPIAFSVYFDFDSSALDANALNDIATAAEAAVAQEATSVEVGGHTDSSGSDAYNDRLSRTRAEVVAAQLTTEGVNAAIINTTSFGESRPAVSTGDGVRERANRRAEVVLYFGGEVAEEETIDFGEPADEPAMEEDDAASDVDDLFAEEEPMAEDEAPAMDEEPMVEEEPAMEEDAPMMDEEPAMGEDESMMDEEPAMEEEPMAEEAPAMDEGAMEEPAAADEAAAEEDTSAEDDLEALFAEDDGGDDGLDGIIE